MKRFSLLLAAAAVLLFAGNATAQVSTLTGSGHDFSGSTPTSQLCIPCHAPHNNQNAATELLWNHDPSTQLTWTMYSNVATMNGAVAATPQTGSIECMTCHDGTAAPGAYNGSTGAIAITTNALVGLGGNLSNDHPISVQYEAALDGELHPTPLGGEPLFNNAVECASCHDVHNTDTFAGAPRLLYNNLSGSAICLDCHQK